MGENSRLQRKKDVSSRAANSDHMYSYCRIIGCNKPARAGTTEGLDRMYCRAHADHYQRHGSPLKPSYKAETLNPYRQAALLWMVEHTDDFWVQDAIAKMRGLYASGGAFVEAFRLRGLKPQERAKAHWARLLHFKIDPMLPIAAFVAIEMVIMDDHQPDNSKEYKLVQAAKIVHRMASGTHKRWEQPSTNPRHLGMPMVTKVQALDWYPKSRGRVLRHIGADLERASELLVDHHLQDIQALKKQRDGQGAYTSSPYPKGFASRSRIS